MNELNKLVQQYEKENPGKRAEIWEGPVCYGLERDFVLWQLASRPTCGKEQRKFLDEAEKKGRVSSLNNLRQLTIGDESAIYEDDVASVSFTKVIKGE